MITYFIISVLAIFVVVSIGEIIHQRASIKTEKYKKRWLEALHTIELLQEDNPDKKLPSPGPWRLHIYTSQGENRQGRHGDGTWFNAVNEKTKTTIRLYGAWSHNLTPEDILQVKDRCMKTIEQFNHDDV